MKVWILFTVLCLTKLQLAATDDAGSSTVAFLSAQTSEQQVDEDALNTNLDTLPDPEPDTEFLVQVDDGKSIPKFRITPGRTGARHNRRSQGKPRRARQLTRTPPPTPTCPLRIPLNDPFVYFANRGFLALMNTDGTGLQAYTNTRFMTAADYDIRDCYIFWSDVAANHIARAKMDGSDFSILVDTDITNPDGLAWNWVNKTLYWTDADERDIESLNLASSNGPVRKKVLQTGNELESIPRAIVVDPVVSRRIYWTDWGSRPRIERASLDGSNREVLHALNLEWPNALAIDIYTQTLYWADAGLDRIECSHADGSNRRVLIAQFILHPFAMDFCNGTLYWSDWQYRAVLNSTIHHTTTQPTFNIYALINNLKHLPMGVKCVSPSKQPTGPVTIREPEFQCVPECQNGGTCSGNSVCTCAPGWRGNRCQEAICEPVCLNGGMCTAPGNCSCSRGWEGSTCEQPICTGGCQNGGFCVIPGVCSCPPGWEGTKCNIPVCSSVCDRGSCTGPDTCTCEHGWTGALCDQAVCNPPCDNGNCVQPDVCVCHKGWAGVLCDDPICEPGCSNGGDCVAPGTCECHSPYYGPTCAKVECFPPSGCLNGGSCVSPSLCACPSGFAGIRCESPLCGSIRCIHGDCERPNECVCNYGWKGKSCDEAICFPPDGCQNGGSCIIPGICSCASGWQGERCDEGICQPSCRHGECTAPDKCACNEGWKGPTCSEAICRKGCVNGDCIRPNLCVCHPGHFGERCEY